MDIKRLLGDVFTHGKPAAEARLLRYGLPEKRVRAYVAGLFILQWASQTTMALR